MRISRQLMAAGVMLLALISGGVLAATPAQADVPQLINFQGILRDGSGNPVANGSYPVIFTVYDALSGGSAHWAETTSVATTAGLFTVLLGAVHPVPDSAFNNPNRWLGIKVSSDPEMTPRQQLVSLGYAYRTSSVDGASGGTITSKVSIGPGHINTGTGAFVAGANNRARGDYSVVSGGGGASDADSNSATGAYSTIGGGRANVASGDSSVVGGGSGNNASGLGATVGGGISNRVIGGASVIGGGQFNLAVGGTATIAGGVSNEASANYTTIGGGQGNVASVSFATVGGGKHNHALKDATTIGGGEFNTASELDATVGGGNFNWATGDKSTVGGGYSNAASSYAATVPGGQSNLASGHYSFAAGRRANAIHAGTFVWADSSIDADFASTAANQFLIRASGGVGIGTNSPTKKLEVAGSIKVGANDTLFSSNLSSNSPLKLQTAGITRVIIDDVSGKVGIGTNSPASMLQVVGGDLFVGTVTAPLGGEANLWVENSSGDTKNTFRLDGYADNLFIAANSAPGAATGAGLIFRTSTAAAGETDRLAITPAGSVGIGTTTPTEKLQVVGNICATGTIGACSDVRFKRSIEPLEDALDKVDRLRGVSYLWDRDKYPEFAEGKQIGFVAQEVQKVLPEVVSEGSDGTLSVDYGRMTAVLVEAMKAQQTRFESELANQREQMKSLEAKLAQLERGSSK